MMFSFTTDAAEKLKISKRTVQEEIQIAEELIEEAEDLIREKGIGKKDALLLAHKTQMEQLDIVEKIQGEEAKTVRGALRKLTAKKQGSVINIRIKTEEKIRGVGYANADRNIILNKGEVMYNNRKNK